MTKRAKLQQMVIEVREKFNDKLSYGLIKTFAGLYFRVQRLQEQLEAYKQAIKELMLKDGLSELEKAGVNLSIRYQKRFKIDPARLKETDPELYALISEPNATRLKKLVDKGMISKNHLDKLLESGAVILTESAALVVKEVK